MDSSSTIGGTGEVSRATAPRVVRARRALPNGRAIVGAFLVTSSAVGAFVVASPDDAGPQTSYLVLTADVAAGEILSTTDVAGERLDLGSTVAATAVAGSADVDGAVALRDLRSGELLVNEDLLASAPIDDEAIGAIHELTIPVPLDRSPAALFTGDRVTILATARHADDVITEVAVEDVVVLRFDTGADRMGGASQGVLTLAVDDAAAVLSLAHSAQQGDVTVVRTTRAVGEVYPASTAGSVRNAEASTR